MHESLEYIENLLNGSLTAECDIQVVVSFVNKLINEIISSNSSSTANTPTSDKDSRSKHAHIVKIIVKNHVIWMHSPSIAERTWIYLLHVLHSHQHVGLKAEIVHHLRDYGGIEFCSASIKRHISSISIIRSSFVCLNMIIEAYQQAKHSSSQDAASTTKAVSSRVYDDSVKHLILQPNIEESSLFRLSPFNLLILELLNSGIGYCLPRSLEYATTLEDLVTIDMSLRSYDLLLGCVKPEYVVKISSYNDWTCLRSLHEVLIFATVNIKKIATKIIIKLVAVYPSIINIFLSKKLWERSLQNIKLYGHALDVEVNWIINCLKHIKSLKNDDMVFSISTLLGIIHDRLRDAEENFATYESQALLRRVMGISQDDIVTRIEPHQVELWPTLSGNNSYGYCIKKIPPLKDRVKKAEEKSKARENAFRFMRHTRSSQDSRDVKPPATPSYGSPSRRFSPIKRSQFSGAIGEELMEAVVDDINCDDENFMASFSCLVLPSMSISSASSMPLFSMSNSTCNTTRQRHGHSLSMKDLNSLKMPSIMTTSPHKSNNHNPRSPNRRIKNVAVDYKHLNFTA
jgi:hypothetical protein